MCGDLLLRAWPLGINVAIWVATLLLAVALLSQLRPQATAARGWWLFPVGLMLAFSLAWRASPVLQALNVGALFVALTLSAFRLREGRLRIGGVTEFVFAGAVSVASCILGPVLLAISVRWRSLPPRASSPVATAIGRGLLLGIPLLAIFGGLFIAADAVFSNLVTGLWQVDGGSVGLHIAWTVFWTWLAAGILWQALIFESPAPPAITPAPFLRLGVIEVSTALGLIDLLFAGFVLVQLRYLFGGAEFVEASAGLTYAEYARRGFFELLAVTALVIPVILAVHWLLRDSGRRLHLTFRVLANILVALLLVVIASALERMRAYVEAFGLTQLRFYSTAFMAWLTLVVLWLCPTALRGHRKHFVAGGVVAALFVIVVLNAVNPDSQIVESNMAGSDRAFDVFYANSLSPDATPTIIANLARLSPAERCTMAQELLSRDQERDWRSWNLSRERADDVIAKNRAELERACER